MSFKGLVRALTPAPLKAWVQSLRWHARVRRILQAFGGDAGYSVKSGPFVGMRYVSQSPWGGLIPRLIGYYEEELHPVLDRIFRRSYDTVIDVGCAEGYYAVGLALRLPSAHVHAFDTDAQARAVCADIGARNGVTARLHIRELCDAGALNGMALDKALIVCDCEGFEVDLLDPAAVPGLAHADMLVETHDHLRPGALATLEQRFGASHDITKISSRVRKDADYPQFSHLTAEDRNWALSEGRPCQMHWLFLQARRDAAN